MTERAFYTGGNKIRRSFLVLFSRLTHVTLDRSLPSVLKFSFVEKVYVDSRNCSRRAAGLVRTEHLRVDVEVRRSKVMISE